MSYWEERLRRRLDSLDELGARNAAFIRAFVSYLIARGVSFARANAYVDTLKLFGRFVGKSFDSVSREDVERFFEWMKCSGYREWTIISAKARVKRFYRWLLGDDVSYPPQVAWIRASSSRRSMPKEVLAPEEVEAMAAAADNIRDKALVLTLYESGLRAGELLELRIRDIEVDRYGAVLRVYGKTGDRRVRVIASAPALLEWLSHHPGKNNPDARVFGKPPDYSRMSYTALAKILRKLAARAGVRKHVHPHLFRHSRATELAKYLTESQLAAYFGWAQGSQMPRIYVHLSGRDIDPALLRLSGLEAVEEEPSKFRLRQCARCREMNPPGERFCRRCGMPLDPEEFSRLLVTPEDRLELERRVDELSMQAARIAEKVRLLEELLMRLVSAPQASSSSSTAPRR